MEERKGTISRQAAIDAIKAYLSDCQIEDADWHGNGIEYELESLPSAEPEIIRCKDCKFYTPIKRTDRWWCRCDKGLWQSNENDFCSFAERKTDERSDKQTGGD